MHLRRLRRVEELHGHAPLHRRQRVARAVGKATHAARLELERRLAPLLRLARLQAACRGEEGWSAGVGRCRRGMQVELRPSQGLLCGHNMLAVPGPGLLHAHPGSGPRSGSLSHVRRAAARPASPSPPTFAGRRCRRAAQTCPPPGECRKRSLSRPCRAAAGVPPAGQQGRAPAEGPTAAACCREGRGLGLGLVQGGYMDCCWQRWGAVSCSLVTAAAATLNGTVMHSRRPVRHGTRQAAGQGRASVAGEAGSRARNGDGGVPGPLATPCTGTAQRSAAMQPLSLAQQPTCPSCP